MTPNIETPNHVDLFIAAHNSVKWVVFLLWLLGLIRHHSAGGEAVGWTQLALLSTWSQVLILSMAVHECHKVVGHSKKVKAEALSLCKTHPWRLHSAISAKSY